MLKRLGRAPQGQTLVETALVLPLFLMVIFGIVVLGIGIFYQQELANAGREAARYAVVHSATAQCPTVSNRDPDPALLPAPNSYFRCDAPANRWPFMTAEMRSRIFGLRTTSVRMTACWSGYWTRDTAGAWAAYDQVAVDPVTNAPNEFRDCTVPVWGWTSDQNRDAAPSAQYVINPRTGRDGSGNEITIDCSRDFPLTTVGDDMASSYAKSNATNANQVTVITCTTWNPPLSGFLLIPQSVTLASVVTEGLEYQQ